jgi:hypothetical protein
MVATPACRFLLREAQIAGAGAYDPYTPPCRPRAIMRAALMQTARRRIVVFGLLLPLSQGMPEGVPKLIHFRFSYCPTSAQFTTDDFDL